MARPKSDIMDERNAPLRSHPPDKPAAKDSTEDKLPSSVTLPPRGSLLQSEQRGRSQERDQQHYRSFSPFKRRGHSELPPIQTSSLGQFIPKSSTGPLGKSDSDFSGERPFLSNELDEPEVHSNKAAILSKEQQGDRHTEHDGSLDEKDKEEYRKFRESLSSLDDSSSEEEESEQRDSLVAEKKDQVRLFRSSLLAGAKAQEDRRGRSRRTLTPPDHPQPGSNVASESETHDSTVSESKDYVVGVQENDDFSFPETLKPLTSFQGEGEQPLDILLDDLDAEDGKEPDVDAVTIQSGEVCPIPPEMLETKAEEGLSDAEVAVRRKKYGWNRMKEQKRNHIINFILFFNGPVQWVMEVAILLAIGLEDWIDLGIICGLLILNAVVGFVQEYQAGNIIDSLKETLALRAVLVRNGSIVEIGAEGVVVGDIVYVQDGTIIPADGRLIGDKAYIQVDQSGITGESLAVDKHEGDLLFASSAVKRGTGSMVVTAIGDRTAVGNAAVLVSKAGNTTGHFTRVLRDMARVLLILVVFTLLVVWISSYYRSNPIVQILEFTLAITVVGVPVGLPVVVTTTMAVGAAYLAKRQAIVQKLSAIESLAGVEILCSDKTGTLTRNRLTLGDPYIAPGMNAELLMLVACLAAIRKKGGIDAIDKVFLKGLRQYPWAKSQIPLFKTLEFTPFDPVSKKVTAYVQALDGEKIVCVKGAPMTILRTVEKETTLCEQFFAEYEAKVNEFANRGFRALGVARKRQGRPWEILGIMPCLDPPRHDTAKTVAEAQELGLSVKMLTGDAVAIARETARRLGLGTNIYNAERLGVTGAGSMSGSEVNDFVEAADGFAEVYPQHKYSVVEILQRRGYLVAMTGDGVNDAASLKKADTGIAVEGASDAARSAADIVFLAPGLSTIIEAIKIARQIFHRMYSYVAFRIALSIHLELFFGLWMVIKNETLDLRLVVLLAIFADVATLAIAYDNASYSQSPVKWNQPRLWGESIALGFILAVGTWVTLGTMLLQGEDGGVIEGWGSRDEVLFLEIALTQSWLILVTRINGTGTRSGSFWANCPSLYLLAAVLAVNLTATLMAAYGAFGQATSWLTVLRVWILSFGVTCVNALAYIVMHNSQRFDNLMHGKGPRKGDRERSWEDFGLNMQRMAKLHEIHEKCS
ncbi:ATPase P-type K/Mg/Cd/Cu/Zn/Na/Ca/Na/H-transporter [Penicillium cf. griseofulvum]|uniref:Plasma membrane ATPase n=1 Tax=Penicillium cf. griseofulvum TaxID=2972120 RepID=A0A9W9JC86_9EURO|nr:ATPase P-type K/Mg/Cd/Cu/Zn/Na/Ca/Na/H-transporter [Penicillium cf. griseofulvum]KAJ5445494.1 ATPase P-type K/Mg/Cd/Cu/Zn/Na/Ca/Na/H-transporter [Penicillium cf. griseofulvum]